MYHIQEDKRAQKSATLILEALQECLKEKDYDSITISDICRTSTVSRATFYRLFDCKDDVISWGLDVFFESFCVSLQGRSIRETLEAYFAAWMENPEVLDLVIRIHREDIPYASYRKRVDLTEQYFMKMPMSDEHIVILSAVITSLLTNWARSGKRETPAALVDVLMRVIGDLNACFSA